MTHPDTSSKLVLVEDRRQLTAEEAVGPVRRYRLARLRFDGRASDEALRFEHLKRSYD